MNERLTTRLVTAESDLKMLMADVTRAVEKAQQAIAKITSNGANSPPQVEITPSQS
jgi:hypothetical protein